MLTRAPYARGGLVHSGLRRVLLCINVFLLVTGVVLIVLGVKLGDYVHAVPRYVHNGDPWWLGLTPLTIGLVGVLCTAVGHHKVLLAWAIYSMLTSVGSYLFFVRKGFFNHANYGVTMRIYGTCSQIGNTCICVISSHVISLSSRQSCDSIRYITSVYLSQMFLMTLVLATSMIGCFLALVTPCCQKCCIIHHEEEKSLLVSGQHTTPTLYRTQQTSVFLTDYTPTNKTRTYLAINRHNGNTML